MHHAKRGALLIIAAALLVGTLVFLSLSIQGPALLAALLAGLALSAMVYRKPKLALSVWLVVACFVPPWVGVSVGTFFPPLTTLGCLILFISIRSHGWSSSYADFAICALLFLSGVSVFFAKGTGSIFASMITMWLVAYLVGKVLSHETGPGFAGSLFAIVLTVAAGLAILELLYDFHPFQSIVSTNSLYDIWSPIQERGGQHRSEWSFGHSIALGGSLALAVPFVIAAEWSILPKLFSLLLLFAGVAVTFSRGAMLAFAVALVLSVMGISQLKFRQRAAFVLGVVVAAVVALPLVGRVFEEAGSEAVNSGDYRDGLFALVKYMEPLGRSSFGSITATGEVAYGRYVSIDNTFIYVGLTLGWIVALVCLAAFIPLVVRFLARRTSPAEVALIAQIPLLFTVAPITQWQSLIWFVAGLAVTWAMHVPLKGTARDQGLLSSESEHFPIPRGNPVRGNVDFLP